MKYDIPPILISIWQIFAGISLVLFVKNLLRSIGEKVQDVAPEVRDKFENVSLNDLVGIMDPRMPLDPQVELVLKELLEEVRSALAFVEVPIVQGLQELKSANEYLEFDVPNVPPSVLNTFDESCAMDIYTQYGPVARACGNELTFALGVIEGNYLRRVLEAGERFERRNVQLKEFELEQLPSAVARFREVLAAIKSVANPEEIREIRANIGYLAASYAYHLRHELPRWHEYGLELNEFYYYKELELIAEIRTAKEAEADSAFGECIEGVNVSITETLGLACPGEEPILY